MSRGGSDDHDVNGAATIFGVGVNYVSPFGVVVVRGDQTLPVYWGVSPVVEEFVKRVSDRFMPFDGPGTISAAHSVVPFGVAVPGARGTIGAPKGAGAWAENVVRHADANALGERIEQLRPLDKEALKTAFKTQLRQPRSTLSGSAGLGLIDMARKATAPLQHALQTLDNGRVLFSLRVIL